MFIYRCFMQKMHVFVFFLSKYFAISNKCCTFAAERTFRESEFWTGVSPVGKDCQFGQSFFYVFGIIFMPTCFMFSV